MDEERDLTLDGALQEYASRPFWPGNEALGGRRACCRPPGPDCRVKKEVNGPLPEPRPGPEGQETSKRSEMAGAWLPNSPESHGTSQRPEETARLQDGARGSCQLPRWRRGAAPALPSSPPQAFLRQGARLASLCAGCPSAWVVRPLPAAHHAAPWLVAGTAVGAGASRPRPGG